MATYVTANENASEEFKIPVSWKVSDFVVVQANSLKEAYDFLKENADDVPLGDDPVYVDDSYEIDAEDVEECEVYQAFGKTICVEFSCGNLSKAGDSTGNEEPIARAKFSRAGEVVETTLVARRNDAPAETRLEYVAGRRRETCVRDLAKTSPEEVLADMRRLAEKILGDES